MATDTERLLHEARAHLGELNHELAIVIGKAATPDDPALLDIDRAIEKQGEKIRRLELMVAAGKVAATAEARRALMKKREDGMANANRLAKERIALAGKIDEAIAVVGPLLDQWEALGIECRRSAVDVNRGLDFGWQYAMLASASGSDGRFAGALEWALTKIKLGSRGILADLNIQAPAACEFYSLKHAAEVTATRLEAQLENVLQIAIKKEEE